ncbi:d-ribose transporter atp binding protein : Ribose import ATP-binding protein RbsA OS=Sorangium cellulosum So0157-2 GN=rbsA PE=3 SV=1: ABC_tran: ABC_tran [Tuwongella immobilis]|uniref:ABC transporter domain-containing protein n=2 Tax=Tuwongella immobilis TaxID=692036 RepID=A0A6C2YNK1_9BACT|nr:d-ribose transporter atp binding protein : Ribose import ATP-binding protein RbsA OS=Sorangium cellulosum So0157-2 GN=rbsA PE=3 SV=1: ABC_tran: ABC_tran [Tuwongella immobilis]VTS02425.1 d-ribose transporter atp binding protein : Ribose import ATP-binding protein RbsA OS=Sorangium cellulosum So0157-2 GN=rbsA PE=3 SV=1: ABC_tran: ABC_tran [Tuwongella immobilis]
MQVRAISKRFPGVIALDNVSLALHPGEVVALVGENGAGKSTLMKILAGVYIPDEGEMLLDGATVRFSGVVDAMQAGICLIHQELNLAGNLSVAANLFLGRETTKAFPPGWLDRAAMRREARTWLQRVGLPEELVDTPVDQLSPGHQQLVEIARALSQQARILIMDEPTSSLTSRETDRLVEVIHDLKRQGVTVVYISHRLGEIQRVADRVVVLRDGKNAGGLDRSAIRHDAIVALMVGRELTSYYPRNHRTEAKQPVLEVRNLRYVGGPEHAVSFTVRAGEVLGMAGLIGAGRTELSEAIFGLRPILSGEIILDGKPIQVRSTVEAIEQGILLVPEDRRYHGLVLQQTVGFNFSLPNLNRWNRLGLVDRRQEREQGLQLKQRLGVRSDGLCQLAGQLSGGNQQKIVLGKWLPRSPRLLILDEPTRGVDVGAKSEMYALMDQLAGDGVAVWMISSDMEEVLGMSDRVVVMHEGRIAGELARAELGEVAIMTLATGAGGDHGTHTSTSAAATASTGGLA